MASKLLMISMRRFTGAHSASSVTETVAMARTGSWWRVSEVSVGETETEVGRDGGVGGRGVEPQGQGSDGRRQMADSRWRIADGVSVPGRGCPFPHLGGWVGGWTLPQHSTPAAASEANHTRRARAAGKARDHNKMFIDTRLRPGNSKITSPPPSMFPVPTGD